MVASRESSQLNEESFNGRRFEAGARFQSKSGLVGAALGAQGLWGAIVKCGYESA